MPRLGADVRDIQNRIPRKALLYAELIRVRSRNLAGRVNLHGSRRREHRGGGIELLSITVLRGDAERFGRVGNRVERAVALYAVIIDSAAGANYEIPFAGDVPGNSEAGTPLQTAVLGQVLIDTSAGLANAIVDVSATWDHKPNVVRGAIRIGYRIVRASRVVRRVDRRKVQLGSLSRIEQRKFKGRCLQGSVVLWLVPGGAQTVIERQARSDLPGILNIFFDVPVTVQTVDMMLRLVEGLIDAQERIGEPVAGIERISTRRTALVAEVVAAVEGSEGRLILPAALHVVAGLDDMAPPDLRHTVGEIDGGIVVDERRIGTPERG